MPGPSSLCPLSPSGLFVASLGRPAQRVRPGSPIQGLRVPTLYPILHWSACKSVVFGTGMHQTARGPGAVRTFWQHLRSGGRGRGVRALHALIDRHVPPAATGFAGHRGAIPRLGAHPRLTSRGWDPGAPTFRVAYWDARDGRVYAHVCRRRLNTGPPAPP